MRFLARRSAVTSRSGMLLIFSYPKMLEWKHTCCSNTYMRPCSKMRFFSAHRKSSHRTSSRCRSNMVRISRDLRCCRRPSLTFSERAARSRWRAERAQKSALESHRRNAPTQARVRCARLPSLSAARTALWASRHVRRSAARAPVARGSGPGAPGESQRLPPRHPTAGAAE